MFGIGTMFRISNLTSKQKTRSLPLLPFLFGFAVGRMGSGKMRTYIRRIQIIRERPERKSGTYNPKD